MQTDGEDYADVDAAAGIPRRDDPVQSRADRAADRAASRETCEPRDERVHDDPFGPPRIDCECYCLHCRRTFMSSEIWFQRIKNAQPGKLDGFWMCPTPNCDGKGFTFDIFPTDPDHPANEGWSYDDDDDEADELDEEWDEEFDAATSAEELHVEYDPNETKWKELDEELGDEDDDDIEGEEWKYGLQPGEELPEPEWLSAGRREREEEERRYDQPDQRPREIDWEYGEGISEDDIPF
jgi:hypothetical protein